MTDIRAQITELRGQGLSYGQIGKRLGITRNAVAGYVSRLGLGTGRKGGTDLWTEEEIEVLRRTISQSVRWEQVAKVMSSRTARACAGKAYALDIYVPFAKATNVARMPRIRSRASGVAQRVYRPPTPLLEPPTNAPVGLLAAGHMECRAIVDGWAENTRYCGAGVRDGSVYSFCPYHAQQFLREAPKKIGAMPLKQWRGVRG